MNQLECLMTRDGHVSMLSLDRYDVGELDDGERHCIESHVEHCGQCRQRFTDVVDDTLALVPPAREHHEAGSATVAYLAASAGVAIAAALVAAIGSAIVPSPHLAQEAEVATVGVASAYTSVAQEFSELEAPQLELSESGNRLIIWAGAAPELAVVVVADEEADGDTGGQDLTEVVDVLLTTGHAEGGRVELEVPSRWSGHRVMAIACAEPLALEVGDAIPTELGCVVTEHVPDPPAEASAADC